MGLPGAGAGPGRAGAGGPAAAPRGFPSNATENGGHNKPPPAPGRMRGHAPPPSALEGSSQSVAGSAGSRPIGVESVALLPAPASSTSPPRAGPRPAQGRGKGRRGRGACAEGNSADRTTVWAVKGAGLRDKPRPSPSKATPSSEAPPPPRCPAPEGVINAVR